MKQILLLGILMISLAACTMRDSRFDLVKNKFQIPDSVDWILVINASTCKTCLNTFLEEIAKENLESGAFLIISPGKKTFLNQISGLGLTIPVIFDSTKVLIDEKYISVEDELALIQHQNSKKIKIQDWEGLKSHLK